MQTLDGRAAQMHWNGKTALLSVKSKLFFQYYFGKEQASAVQCDDQCTCMCNDQSSEKQSVAVDRSV